MTPSSQPSALREAADLALKAIDTVLSAHAGQAEYAELKTAFDALESSLSSPEAQPGEWRTPSGADCHPESPHSISPREQELEKALQKIVGFLPNGGNLNSFVAVPMRHLFDARALLAGSKP